MTPPVQQVLFRLCVALALGLLIGLERGWEGRELAEGQRPAGFRTFALISLLGGVSILLVQTGDWVFMPVAVLALSAFMALGYWRVSADGLDLSVTTAVSALLAFALGALAVRGDLVEASAATVVVVLLLSIKPELHALVRHIERSELLATIRLLLISVVLLPILPDQGYGPWQAVNPYRIWWMVVLVALLSYVGYYAVKFTSDRVGVMVTALFGGLSSSTAATAEFSRQGRDAPGERNLLAAGVVVACAVMFPRMLAMAAIANPDFVMPLAWPAIPAGVVTLAVGAWWLRHPNQATGEAGKLQSRNPLDLKAALTFGVLLAAIMVLARAMTAWFGNRGVYVASAISGLADVDAVTLSLASLARQHQIQAEVAVFGACIAAAVNSGMKAAIVFALCGTRMALRVAIALVLGLLAGAAALWLS